jgi:hypothetical protein
MVRFVRSLGPSLAILVQLAAASARAAGPGTPPPTYLRTSLDDPRATIPLPAEPRRIRRSLDDPSHRSFPLNPVEGRLIRVSLDEGTLRPAHPSPDAAPAARRVRQTLD